VRPVFSVVQMKDVCAPKMEIAAIHAKKTGLSLIQIDKKLWLDIIGL
jgi:hypothetical protein